MPNLPLAQSVSLEPPPASSGGIEYRAGENRATEVRPRREKESSNGPSTASMPLACHGYPKHPGECPSRRRVALGSQMRRGRL